MNRIYLVTIFILIVSLIFAIQNTATVAINFLIWHFYQSQALTVFLIFLAGFISGIFAELPAIWKKNQQLKAANKKLSEGFKSEPPATSTPV
ncbi:MAG: LapA family protein [Chitinophagales bacterium]|nr:LapA family protein [Chitinophagales bacterium]